MQVLFETEGLLSRNGVSSISDIAVDWIGKNIYYADTFSGSICK